MKKHLLHQLSPPLEISLFLLLQHPGSMEGSCEENAVDWSKEALCLYQQFIDSPTAATADVFIPEDSASLETFSYAALGCLVPGLFLVILGLCLRKTSEEADDD